MNDRAGRARKSEYDAIVVGGGPAGSTAAALIAAEGASVLLLDREAFPRFRIGESLMPATYWSLQRLGVLERMKASGFPRKHSVQFYSPDGRPGTPFYFKEFDSHESSATWQVDRLEFDTMLLENAVEKGAEVHQQVNVRDVMMQDSRAVGVVASFGDGDRQEIGAKVVVDASGQSALIARKLGLREVDPELKHCAFYTRFRGAQRDCGIDEGATLVLHTQRGKCWFWYIPLPDDVVSVGVVGPIDDLVSGRSRDPQQVFDEEVEQCPALQPKIEHAERLAPAQVLRDFSYISRRIAGDGWIMAGDAFGFLDPIYSTGVFLALKSGELAADAVVDALKHDQFDGGRLGRSGQRYIDGMEAMRKLVYAYYDEHFSFPKFLNKHPEFRKHVIHLLIGNVFRESVDGLFEAMGEMCELPPARRLATVEESR